MAVYREFAKSPWLARPLERATAATLRLPYATLACAVVLALAALVLSGFCLGYKTGRMDLLDPSSDYHRRWIQYCQEFGEQDDAIVVVQGADRKRITAVLDELAETLIRDDHLFEDVLHRVDPSRLQAKGLYYRSVAELQDIDQFLDRAAPVVDGQWSRLNATAMTAAMHAQLAGVTDPDPADLAAASQYFQALGASLRNEYVTPWPSQSNWGIRQDESSEYLLAPDGRMGFLLLHLTPGIATFARGSHAIDQLRQRIAAVQARHRDIRIGLTGLPVLENDEMRSSSRSMLWASLLSFLGVSLLFVVGFRGIRHALTVNLVLLMSMAWAFGYATLAVGHLNILSVSFTVTLIGIGIDYGIHYIARYLHRRREGMPCREALLAASREVGPAIVTGALTTAIAFFAAAMTSFTGSAELGLIAGGGLLLCAAGQLFVLPAALLILDQNAWATRLPEPLPVHRWMEPLLARSRPTLVFSMAATLLVAMGLPLLHYDHNLLNLQSPDLESVQLERALLADSTHSSWYALSVCSGRDQLLARKDRLLQFDTVDRVDEIVSLLPNDDSLKQPLIERIHDRLSELPEQPPAIGVDAPEDLEGALGRVSQLTTSSGMSLDFAPLVEKARHDLRHMSAAEAYATLSRFQQQSARDLLDRLQALRQIADPQPPDFEDLPPPLLTRFVGREGRLLLKVFGRGDLWDPSTLERFIADVRSVDAQATGHPLQAYEASREMKHGYDRAALYALGAILVVLVLDFQSLKLALLAATPLALGVLQTFGCLGMLNISLNPANIIALPLMLGIGIDYGVHIMHDYTACKGPYRISASTAVAVLIDSLTTIVGFGSLMIATHQGLASLGLVLTLGMVCCLFSSLVVLPALLSWFTNSRRTEAHMPSTSAKIAA